MKFNKKELKKFLIEQSILVLKQNKEVMPICVLHNGLDSHCIPPNDLSDILNNDKRNLSLIIKMYMQYLKKDLNFKTKSVFLIMQVFSKKIDADISKEEFEKEKKIKPSEDPNAEQQMIVMIDSKKKQELILYDIIYNSDESELVVSSKPSLVDVTKKKSKNFKKIENNILNNLF